MTNHAKKAVIAALAFVVLAAGCSLPTREKMPVNYYTLEYDAPNIPGEPVNEVVRVERFSMSPLYKSPQMAYREEPYKRGAYNYHKWRSAPGDLVSYFLARDMREAGVFGAALSFDSRVNASYALDGMVEEFYERDGENGWEAVLTVSALLVRQSEPDVSKRVVFQRRYSAAKPAESKSPSAVAQAMSEAMKEVSGKIIRDVYGALKK